MKFKLIPAALLLAMIAPVTHAQFLSIDDLGDTFTLQVGGTGSTSPNPTDPGTGNFVDIIHQIDSNGVSNIVYNQPSETLSFTFANQVNWPNDVYLYQYYTEPGTGNSDLFVIQGLAGTKPDYITFISDPGNLLTLPDLIAGSTATKVNLGDTPETGAWQLAYDTGVDQYYIRSDVPEPATLSLLVLGAGLLGFRRRPQADSIV